MLGNRYVYNPRTDLIYSLMFDPWVRVIDPVSDSVVEIMNTVPAYSMAVNTADNELYVGSTLRAYVQVVDCSTHTVVDTVDLPEPAQVLCWYGPLDKLYVLGDSVVAAVDCRSRAVTKVLPIGDRQWVSAVSSERSGSLWVTASDTLWVIRCLTDSVVAVFPGAASLANMVWNPIENRVYLSLASRLLIYRDDLPSRQPVVAGESSGFSFRPLWNPAAHEVRFECALSDAEPALLRIFDAIGRQVWSSSVGAGQRSMVWPGRDRQGRRVATGVYVARLESGTMQATAKVVFR